MKILSITCAAGALLAASGQDADPAAATGSISGKAMFQGERPEPKPPVQPKEEELQGCHHEGMELDFTDQSLLVDENGGVANVVVLLEVDGVEPEIPEEPIVMDQVQCRFEPHVMVLPVGATIRYDNSDETNHNIHTYARKNKNINNNIAGGSHYDMQLDKEETFEVGCDIHPWMKSYVVVTEATHWAVSEPDGSFEITGLPPGDYKADWWHETLGKGKADVTVKAGEAAEVVLELEEGGSKRGGRRRR